MKRLILATLASLALIGTALAQETTMPEVTILAKVQRQGTLTSSSIVVPALANPDQDIIIRALMDAADIENTTLSFTFRIYFYDEEQAIWYQHGAMTWRGAPWVSPRPKVPPFMAIPLGELVGKTVRVELDIPDRMKLGATAEVK